MKVTFQCVIIVSIISESAPSDCIHNVMVPVWMKWNTVCVCVCLKKAETIGVKIIHLHLSTFVVPPPSSGGSRGVVTCCGNLYRAVSDRTSTDCHVEPRAARFIWTVCWWLGWALRSHPLASGCLTWALLRPLGKKEGNRVRLDQI